MNLHVVILAAGKGTRMKSQLTKVLHPIAGKPLVAHVVDEIHALNPVKISFVIGHGGTQVKDYFSDIEQRVEAEVFWVEQTEQLGTGHAVMQALPNVKPDEKVLVLYGDVPLIKGTTLQRLLDNSRISSNQGVSKTPLGILTVDVEEPKGYGRIVRESGSIIGIIEEKDASDEVRAIKEINTGIMAFSGELLLEGLPTLQNNNAQGEYYLTDMVSFAVKQAVPVVSVQPDNQYEVEGVNDKLQLATLERIYQYEMATALLRSGVGLADPNRIDIRGSLTVGQDVFIDANVTFIGKVVLGDRVTIGPNCVVENSQISEGTTLFSHTVVDDAVIGSDCRIGPYARIRPGTHLANEVKVGNFVETKKAIVGHQSKLNHLSYVGDSEIGVDVNIGAGTITCNYDGVNKHKTIIDDGAFIGSNSSLVAPVVIGKGATIGAGTTLTKDAPAGKLTLERSEQKTSDKWARPVKQVKDR